MLKAVRCSGQLNIEHFLSSQSGAKTANKPGPHFSNPLLFRRPPGIFPLDFKNPVHRMDHINRELFIWFSNLSHPFVDSSHKTREPKLMGYHVRNPHAFSFVGTHRVFQTTHCCLRDIRYGGHLLSKRVPLNVILINSRVQRAIKHSNRPFNTSHVFKRPRSHRRRGWGESVLLHSLLHPPCLLHVSLDGCSFSAPE